MLYGHGLLGSADQVDNGSQRDAANESCRIVIGTDLRGMSDRDLPNVAQALNDAYAADTVFSTDRMFVRTEWRLDIFTSNPSMVT